MNKQEMKLYQKKNWHPNYQLQSSSSSSLNIKKGLIVLPRALIINNRFKIQLTNKLFHCFLK